ncbi:MAG TPA: Ig-like domain-containing protein [Gemmatimonadales bacterium]|nr:Ig-like domain-containing protein [Gemmatimonadales bacterium]
MRRLALGLAVAVAAAGCGGGDDITVPPTTGTLQISTSTSGAEQDVDGYTVQIDAEGPQAIGATATLTATEITPGSHSVLLGGVAANCTVAGDNPRAVSVTAGETADLSFIISCVATTGTIQVSVTTSGSPADPDGYLVQLDGAAPGLPIPVTGSASLTGVANGDHVVVLSGLAGNCTADGGPSRAVSVTGGATVTASFAVTCTATATEPSASRSSVTVAPGSFAAGQGSSTITVRIRDAGGTVLSNVPVSVTSSGTGNEIVPATSTTNNNGVATFSFRSTVSESKTITVVAGAITLNDQPVVTVFQSLSTTQITRHDPNPSTSGQTVHVEFTVTGEGGGTPAGEVSIFSLQEIGGCTVPVSQGFCDFTLSVVGTHTIGASYSGDPQFQDSFASVQHEVVP